MRSLDKIFDKFVDNVIKNGVYANKDDIVNVVYDIKRIIENNKDKTPEEIIEIILNDNIEILKEMMNSNMPIPGFTTGINVSNINVKIFGGYKNFKKEPLSENALFDCASITKFLTEIVAYSLISDGFLNLDDNIKELDNSKVNLDSVTIEDILTFNVEFRTNGRLENMKLKEAFQNCLNTVVMYNKGEFHYNDIGMMILKDVFEKVMGVSFEQLVKIYIFDKLNITDMYLKVPKNKTCLITGTPNILKGLANDPKVVGAGGYSGHAGMFSTNDALIKLGNGIYSSNILGDKTSHLYTVGKKDNRAIIGTAYVSHPKGVNRSFVSNLSSNKSFALQGSTKTQLNVDKFVINKTNYIATSTILLNPASMSIEEAKKQEAIINEERQKNGEIPLSLVKHFVFNNDGEIIEYDLIDVRKIIPFSRTINPLTDKHAEIILKFIFLSEYIKEYDKNYNKKIEIIKKI